MKDQLTEQQFTERVRDVYQAPALSASQAARFDAALAERLRPRRWLAPTLAGLALAAAALVFWVLRPAIPEAPAVVAPVVAVAPVALDAPDELAEEDGLLAFLEPEAEEESMPDDYLALADLLDL